MSEAAGIDTAHSKRETNARPKSKGLTVARFVHGEAEMTQEFVSLQLDGKRQEVRADAWRLWLLPGDFESPLYLQVDGSARLTWSELNRLEALVELHYAGSDVAVVEYLASQPRIKRFFWHDHDQGSVDIASLSLEEFGLACQPSLAELKLPHGGLQRLNLYDLHKAEGLQVKAIEFGAGNEPSSL